MPAKFSRYTVFFRKSDSDISEVIMKRRQQDSQAKAAKCCSTEKTLSPVLLGTVYIQ